jgi:hypothetical protein
LFDFNDYPGGPKDIQRSNQAIQDRQKRIDEENQQKLTAKRDAEYERQKLLTEREQVKRKEYEKKEAVLQKRYIDEYVNNEGLQYIVTAKDYNGILNNNLLNLKKESSKADQSKLSKITKENLAFTALIYADLNTTRGILDNILNAADEEDKALAASGELSNKNECLLRLMRDYASAVKDSKTLSTAEAYSKAYDDALVNCGFKDSPIERSLKTSVIYSEISIERKRMSNLQAEVYQDAYTREKALFKKMTGFSFYGQENHLEYTLSSLLSDSQWKPELGYLYSLRYMQAMQTIGKGILMTQNIPSAYNKTAFLDTNINFVDGQALDGYYAYYVGTRKYQSLAGPRNVYAFNLFQYNSNQSVKGRQFYFYPKVLNISAIEEKVINDAFGKKSKK